MTGNRSNKLCQAIKLQSTILQVSIMHCLVKFQKFYIKQNAEQFYALYHSVSFRNILVTKTGQNQATNIQKRFTCFTIKRSSFSYDYV